LQARSFGSVGVDAICREAEVNKGSFYHFFATKSELVAAVLERAWEGFQRDVLEPSFCSEVAPLERLRRFFRATHLKSRQQDQDIGHVCGCFFGSLGCELSGQDEMIRRKTLEIMDRVRNYLEVSLADAVSTGDIKVGDVALAAKALLGYWQGMMLLAKLANDTEAAAGLSAWLLDRLSMGEVGLPANRDGTILAEPVMQSGAVNLDFID
jgi:TetR/AcrR family transcriptional repressor of nem operon